MKIPDEAVQAAMKAWLHEESYEDELDEFLNDEDRQDNMRAALTAAAPFLQGVKVKELEWTNGVVDIAQPQPGMKYVACSTTPNGSWAWWLDNAPETRGVFLSEEAAKAAAQADYEARIRSALEPSARREQALEEEEFAIDKLRFRAFHTNSDADRQAYFDAVSKWFQHRHYRRMDAERALSSQPVAGGWLPIETAPNNKAILVQYDDGNIELISADDNYYSWIAYTVKEDFCTKPTHWRPLPASPGASTTRPTGGRDADA